MFASYISCFIIEVLPALFCDSFSIERISFDPYPFASFPYHEKNVVRLGGECSLQILAKNGRGDNFNRIASLQCSAVVIAQLSAFCLSDPVQAIQKYLCM